MEKNIDSSESAPGADFSPEAADKIKSAKTETPKFNSEGLPVCALCGHADMNLTTHLKEAHNVSVEEYQDKFPGFALQAISGAGTANKLSYKSRATKKYSVKDTFGFWWKIDTKGPKDREVIGYAEPGPLTPKINPDYVFDADATSVCLLALYLRNKLLLYGPSGSGKTTLIEQICARLNYNFVRVNLDAHISRADLIGQWVVKDRSMEFMYGILPRGMVLPGTVLCFDEWDTINEETAFVLQRPLEENSQLLIMEKGEEVVSLHPDNMICCTANTAGMGDDSGLYSSGTRIQNFSQINRFQMTIILDYLSAEKETQILLNRFGENSHFAKTGVLPISKVEAEAMVQTVNAVRQAFVAGTVSSPLSTRDLINWGEKFCIWGRPGKAAKYCFINRMPAEDRTTVEGLVQRAFGSD